MPFKPDYKFFILNSTFLIYCRLFSGPESRVEFDDPLGNLAAKRQSEKILLPNALLFQSIRALKPKTFIIVGLSDEDTAFGVCVF